MRYTHCHFALLENRAIYGCMYHVSRIECFPMRCTVCMTSHRNRLQFECDRGHSAEANGKRYGSGGWEATFFFAVQEQQSSTLATAVKLFVMLQMQVMHVHSLGCTVLILALNKLLSASPV